VIWAHRQQGDEVSGDDDRRTEFKQITVRLPADLHMQLKLKCVRVGRTMNDVFEEMARNYVKFDKAGPIIRTPMPKKVEK
jgi:uncharacterized protein YbaP (TraB family)